MNVLVVTNMWPSSEQGEYGIFVKEQLEGVKKYYPDVTFQVYYINGKKSSISYLKSIFNINFILLTNKFDLIHIHFGLSGLFTLFNPIIKYPIVTTMHGSDLNKVGSSRLINFISQLVAYRSTMVLLVNNSMLDRLISIKYKVSILPCGINTSFFRPLQRCKKEPNEIIIGFPSSKQRVVKNYSLFKQIISLLEEKIQRKVRVVEFSNKSRIEIHKSLNEIDLLLMTSLSEGSPQIIKEALSCNTPVVSTNVGDVSNLLNGVNNSYIVESFDPYDFLRPIIRILNQNVTDDSTSSGRSRIIKLNLDEESISNRLFSIYCDLVYKK